MLWLSILYAQNLLHHFHADELFVHADIGIHDAVLILKPIRNVTRGYAIRFISNILDPEDEFHAIPIRLSEPRD